MSKPFVVNENGILESINIDKNKNSIDLFNLNLSFLNICTINDYVFFNKDNSPKFPNLKILDLSNNCLNDLNWFPDLFDKGVFENLEILNLNNNEIRYIDYTFFEKLPKLKELHLAFNKINKINFISFSNNNTTLTELEHIYLNNNYISQLNDTLEIIKSDTPFLDNELYTLNKEDIKISFNNIRQYSIFKNLNKNVIINIHNNLLIKYNIEYLNQLDDYRIINYSYMYNLYLSYYDQSIYEDRLLFERYKDYNFYINHIEEKGINSFIDYFIYFIYQSLNHIAYLSYFFILNGTKDILNDVEITEETNNKYYYIFNNNEYNPLSMDLIINNIQNKNDMTKINKKNLNDSIKILFKINNKFYKQNNSTIIDKNKDNEDYDEQYQLDYLVRTFVSFNDMIYNLNSNIYLENSSLSYTNKDNLLFINNIYQNYNYYKNTDSDFFTKNELNEIFKGIIINFNESIKNFSNELIKEFPKFNSKYEFPENINHLNQNNNTIKYYKTFEYHINFLTKNIQYILLNNDDWNLLFKSEYENKYKSILDSIYRFIEGTNLYLYLLLVNNDDFMRYYKNLFFQNIIDLYKKCALNLYIKNSNNIIFYNLLKYLNLYDHEKKEFNINHLTAIQIDSFIDYYIMYMNELYDNHNIINEYILNPYNLNLYNLNVNSILNLPINFENNIRISNHIKKYLFTVSKSNHIQLKYNKKPINKYFYETYIEIFLNKFKIISGHGTTIVNTLNIIPKNQTVHFLAKSKVNLSNIFKSDNKYINNIPYNGVYQRGLDKFENYYIMRPLYKTQKYNSGMLCESYSLDPKSVYNNKKNPSLHKNTNMNNVLHRWRYGGIFEVKNIFKNVCKTNLYKKYKNSINRKDNIFIDSIYHNNKNDYYKVIDYSFIVNKIRDTILKKIYKSRVLKSKELSEENKNNFFKELSEENKNNFFKELSEENKNNFSKEMYKELANYKSMYIDFLQKILFGESDKSYFNRNEIIHFYLLQSYAKKDYKLINFLKKNKDTSHTYFVHMCRGTHEKSNNKLLKHILKNILQLHLLVESKKKFINKLISKNSGLIKHNLLIPPVENNPIFLKTINTKGKQLLNKNNSQISLSTQFIENHFDVNNYSLYKIYQDISHIINIYQKNYPKEQLRNNYHLNIIVEGLEELHHFIYESYEISYEDIYKILKKLLVLKKLIFTHINVASVEGIGQHRLTHSNISQSYKKENGTNILHLSESNKEKHKVAKNSKLKEKKVYATNNLITSTKRKSLNY